ncbi:hypothetical protein [Rhodococcus sp. OK302]|uniref:hypothetical protein n=1 Tax=Rhodococcus sp. OK302 TaxID=1882769 RepID=UPI000B93D695|nr:hypothetical protein [Rhodococcus sp. OK302]OYD61324.1 hypothetical protein BDB13_6296 [Rhodococcus sp. OK302]
MKGTSQGNPHPEPGTTPIESDIVGKSHPDPENVTKTKTFTAPDIQWAETVRSATAKIEHLEAFNADSAQRGSSWALPVTPSEQSRVPIWSGRTEWLRQLRHQVTATEGGRAALAKEHLAVDTLMACANAHARFAETQTGRGVTASKARIADHAGVSDTTLKRARRVLKALSMGVEHARGRTLSSFEYLAAEAHHGGSQHKAASTWSLSSPKAVVISTPPIERPQRARRSRATARVAAFRTCTQRKTPPTGSNTGDNPQPGARGPLSSNAFVCSSSSVGSTHQRARARKNSSNHTTQRPIELQRAAASLATHAPAFDPKDRIGTPRQHIGTIADGIRGAGIDTTRWSGRDIAQTLSRHTAETGQIWPTASAISSPSAFLRWKLSQLDWTGPSPSEKRTQSDETRRKEITERQAERTRRDAAAASAASRAAARAAFAQHLADARMARTN